jgi:hypothetical protein
LEEPYFNEFVHFNEFIEAAQSQNIEQFFVGDGEVAIIGYSGARERCREEQLVAECQAAIAMCAVSCAASRLRSDYDCL